jgi:hypothetical protein
MGRSRRLGLVIASCVGVAACGGVPTDVAPTTTTRLAVSSTGVPAAVTHPEAGTLPAGGVAPTVPLPTPVPTRARPVTTTAVERPDPADAPPPDVTLPRNPNVGDRSSPYGPFGPFDVQALDAARVDAVTTAVHDYIDRALVGPIRNGTPTDLAGLLTAPALEGLLPAQRGALTDEGMPAAADAAVERQQIDVSGLVAPDGSAVAIATVDIAVSGTTDAGPVRTTRTGTLTYVVESGTWRIDAFELDVAREQP